MPEDRSSLPWKVTSYNKDGTIRYTFYFQYRDLAMLAARMLNTSSLAYENMLSTWVSANR